MEQKPAFQSVKVRLPDGREYGPVEIGVVNQWIASGRVPSGSVLIDAQTGAEQHLGTITAETSAPLSGLIPYKNTPALIGYYLGVFSLIPCIGLILGPAALVLGILGLRRVGRTPEAKGVVHAWVAIVLGALTSAANVWALFLFLPRWMAK